MEIERAQAVVRALEGPRDDAEHHASRARALARKLQSENRALVAKEEGRKEGYEAGFAHGTVMAREQRRLEAEIEIRRQRQIAAAIPEPPPSAFIEELSGEEEGRRNVNNLSRGVSDARPAPPQAPPEARRRRETVDSVRSTEQRPGEPPPFPVLINNQAPPPQQRPLSVPSARCVNAPPVVTQQTLPRSRTASMDSRARPPSRSSATPTPALNRASSSSVSRSRSQSQSQQTRRNSTAGRSSAGVPPLAIAPLPPPTTNTAGATAAPPPSTTYAGNAQTRDPRRRTSSTSALVVAMMLRNILPPAPAQAQPAPPPTIPMPGLIRMPAPPMPAPAPAPATVVMPPPTVVIQQRPMPTHVPMPVPPPGVGLAMPSSAPAPMPAAAQALPRMQLLPQAQQQFEVERGLERARPPSSVSTSLRTLRLTSFPLSANAGGTGSERDYPTGANAYAVGGGAEPGAGMGREREMELSVILEHAGEGGSPRQLDSGNGGEWYAPGVGANLQRSQTSWTRRSSLYSDPSGVALEEWRRRTDKEAPRNALPPPSPVTPPGMLGPYDPRPNVHPQLSQESFNSNLRRSWSGSSERTVNITIIPPSRPPSAGHSAGLPTEPRFLSPNNGGTPVVPEEDEDEDEDDEDEESDGSDVMPLGYVMGPLPAFAQGVTYPPGFVPMSMGPAPIGLPLVGVDGQIQQPSVPMQNPQAQAQNLSTQNAQMPNVPSQAQWYRPEPQQQPRPASRRGGGIYGAHGANENGTATWTAPPLIGANAMEPVRLPSPQIGGILGNPALANAAWGGNAIGAQPSRPSSLQGELLGNPANVVRAAPPLQVEPAQPSSRLGNPSSGWGGAPADDGASAESPGRDAG
ncbi:hypothetical protein B0H13DRAFT_38470 [Mycena leptocephala]|nr:hypothetical protein B0H13DRAFT_38470 [Mycena leptocephala]